MNKDRAIKKALQSNCKFRVAAFGFNRKGEMVISKTNVKRFSRKGGGIHAEQRIFSQARRYGILTILICRVGKGGKLRPINPCISCTNIANKLGITIRTVTGIIS